MKKIVSTILASALALSLCACSTTQPTQETQTSASVTDMGIKPVDPANTDIEIVDGTDTITVTRETENTQAPQTNGKTVHIVLDNMTADEIVANLNNLTDISPSDAWGSYESRFDVSPDNNAQWEKQYQNQILNYNLMGISENMDGTTAISTTIFPSVYVSFCISDYDLAVGVYDKFIEQYTSMGYTVNDNNRQGTSWVALFDPYSIQLDKTLDYYTLQLWMPLSNQTINSQGIPVVDGQ